MRLISRSSSGFRGQGGVTVYEGDTFYIDGDTPEKDLSQRGKEFLGSLRSGNQFLYPDTPEADEFLTQLAKSRKSETEKKDAKAREERAKKNAEKEWWEKPRGMLAIGIAIGFVAGVGVFVFCQYLIHRFPSLFHS